MTDSVELLRPQDMLIVRYCNGDRTRGCMSFWRLQLLEPADAQAHEKVCKRIFGCRCTSHIDYGWVTKADAAAIYNHCLHAIGYTEGNPPLSDERIKKLRGALMRLRYPFLLDE